MSDFNIKKGRNEIIDINEKEDGRDWEIFKKVFGRNLIRKQLGKL